MVNNNIPRVSALEFATSFNMDNSLIKKSYLYSILLITLSFFIAFPQSKVIEPPPPPPPPPIDWKVFVKKIKPNVHKVFVKVHAAVVPDPTPNEIEVASGYIYDDPEAERDAMYEGEWLYQPKEVGPGEKVTVAKPECNEKVQPFYPELARRAGIQGVVIVRITIGVDGSITDAVVKSSPGRQFGFDDAALNAVRQWKCEPAMINDRKVETEGLVTVNFKMVR